MKEKDFNELLGINANSSAEEAKRALRKELLKFHPDKFQQNKERFYETSGVDDDDKVSRKASEYTQDLNSTYHNLYEKEDPKTEVESQKKSAESNKFVDKLSAKLNELNDKLSAKFNELNDKYKLSDKVSTVFNKLRGRSGSYDVNGTKGQGSDEVDGKGMSGEDKSKGADPKSAEQPEVPSSEKEAHNFNEVSDQVRFMKKDDLRKGQEGLGGVKPEALSNASQKPDSTPPQDSEGKQERGGR